MLRTVLQSQPRRPPADPEAESLPGRPEQPHLPAVRKSKQASVLVSAFLAICLTIGYNQCYGVFQEYYLSPHQDVLDPAPSAQASPPTAKLALVGTLAAGMNWMGSLAVTPLISRIEQAMQPVADVPSAGRLGGRRPAARLFRPNRLEWVTLSGVLLMASGFLLASFATRMWQLLLTQSLLYGVGSSLLYFPLLSPAPEYFTRLRATAIGLILSGGGAGGLALGPAVRALLSAVGGRWTLRALAGLCLLLGVPVALSVPRSRLGASADAAPSSASPPRLKARLPRGVLLSPALLLSAGGACCGSAGAQLPLAFIPTYSVALGLSAGTGATLLAVANAVNAVARVGTGNAGDRLGRLNALQVSLTATALAGLALWGLSVKSFAVEAAPTATSTAVQLWLAFIILYSIAAGGYYALFPATIADVFGIRNYAAVNGFIYFIRGCGTMVGSPVGGVLLSRKNHKNKQNNTKNNTRDGALLLSSVVCILGLRWVDAVRRGWAWRA